MAAKEKLDLGEEKTKLSSKGLILIVLGAVLATLISVFAALYFLGIFPPKNHGGAHGKVEAETEQVEKPVIYLPLAPPFVANFKNNPEARLVQIEISLAAREQKAMDAVTKHMPMLRNNVLLILGGEDPAVLKTAEGKEALRGKIKEEINKVLSEQGELKEGIDEVYFTGFVMQ